MAIDARHVVRAVHVVAHQIDRRAQSIVDAQLVTARAIRARAHREQEHDERGSLHGA
jgi:hypothetical protein